MRRPRVFGLTGNIGAGKSTVAKILEQLFRIHVIRVDEVAEREVLKGHLCQDIEGILGTNIYRKDENERRVLCWKKVREACFASREAEVAFRNWLAETIWPIIEREIATLDTDVVFIEHALLYEVGWNVHCSAIVCVWCEDWVAIKRLVLHRNYSQSQAWTRLRGQMSGEEKACQADLSINTTNIELSELGDIVKNVVSHLRA